MSVGRKSHFQVLLGPRTGGGKRKSIHAESTSYKQIGRGGAGGQSGNHPPLGLGWSVTTQDPSSTPTGLTQNLGHPPRMAVSPPTAWLQSDYIPSAKRLLPQGPASTASPCPSAPSFACSWAPGGAVYPRLGTGCEEGGPCPPGLPSLVWGWVLLPRSLASLRPVPHRAWEPVSSKERLVRRRAKRDPHPSPFL